MFIDYISFKVLEHNYILVPNLLADYAVMPEITKILHFTEITKMELQQVKPEIVQFLFCSYGVVVELLTRSYAVHNYMKCVNSYRCHGARFSAEGI